LDLKDTELELPYHNQKLVKFSQLNEEKINNEGGKKKNTPVKVQ